MRKEYRVQHCWHDTKIKPAYYENLVDLVEGLVMSYFRVYVDGSEALLNAVQATALLYYPSFHKDMDYILWSSGMVIQNYSPMTCVVSEVEVDQNGNLLSTSS